MLQLKAIKKDYQTGGGSVVQALKGVDLRFRENEFVSILGPSGCGKTTLLNIIGGLDHYTSGDLVICGRSTKDYEDHDWDVYRNHRIGFVFQSYNLIPHQTVLGNVEIALTIAGVSKAERRKRAEEALARVGLSAELNKRPNQLSGGQMQRVAIARALVNNPEILLADEPTGALDTETSVQIMDLIREIAGERLVIMVTHNPELAEQYSSRIVKLQDGLVVADSNPYVVEETQVETVEEINAEKAEKTEEKPQKKDAAEKAAMSFGTSLGLSAQNLISKKGRTIMTSVAGSIGIISVCLVLALSSGFNGYIKKTEEDMLSYYPIEITETTLDMTAIISGMASASDIPDLSELGDKVYVNSFLTNIAQGMTVTNDLSKEYLDYLESTDPAWYTAIEYDTGVNLSNNLFTKVEIEGTDGQLTEAVLSLATLKQFYTAKLTEQEEKYANLAPLVDYLGSVYGKMPGTADFDSEEYGEYVLSQYDLVGENSRFPQQSNEAVLVIGDQNDVTDLTLAQLGFISEEEFLSLFPQGDAAEDDKRYETLIDFNKIIGKKYMLNYNDALYTAAADDAEYLYEYSGWRDADKLVQGEGKEIVITGILRLKEDRTYGCLESGLNLTEVLYNEYIAANMKSQIAETLRKQGEANQQLILLSNQLKDIPMSNPDGTVTDEYKAKTQEILAFMFTNGKYFKRAAENLGSYYLKNDADGAVRYILYGDTALRAVGGKDKVNSIHIYTDDFEYKELLLDRLDAWNDSHDKSTQVRYTDTVGLMMSMMQTMLNAITYVLVAFTSISLVVSSVMIGIITYVSVVERVKEIGVLRSLGARKSDIKNLFNAETFIIGLASGVIGVGVSYLLCLLINAILKPLTGIATLASLPFGSALIMVVISVVLTLISGLIPAQSAANKDPVVALRTE